MPGNTFLRKAGPEGTAIAMGIAAVIMVIVSFNYQYLIRKYPVAGGDFPYAYKAFGEKHAFVCSWFQGLSYLAIVPLNATALALIGRNLMNNVFQVGFHYVVAGYDIYLGEVLLAAVALILFGWLSIRGVQFSGVFQTAQVFLLVGGVIIITAAAVPEGYTGWVEYIKALPKLDGLHSLPTFHAGYQLLGSWGLLFLGLEVLGAILSGIIGFCMAASRLFYSMAKEKALPTWFGKLHSEYKTPCNAIGFIMVIALTAPFLWTNGPGLDRGHVVYRGRGGIRLHVAGGL